jgi:septum formation protein
MNIILASQSPRRAELFKKITPVFEISVSKVAEVVDPALSPKSLAMLNAKNKAADIFNFYDKLGDDRLVVGADTVVVCGGRILNKPKDAAEARAHLKFLSARVNTVISGFYIVNKHKNVMDYDVSTVTFNKLTAAQIDKYVKSGLCTGYAGGYGIQDADAYGFLKSYSGSYDNILGLPVEKLRAAMAGF